MIDLCDEALTKFKTQLEHRPLTRKGGDEKSVVAPIIESFLELLGFNQLDRIPQFRANSSPNRITDIACRYPDAQGNRFLSTRQDPLLLVELKPTGTQLNTEHRDYWEALRQLREQLLGTHCTKTRFGLLTNGWSVQLFRRHRKVIHPVTPLLELQLDTIKATAQQLLKNLHSPERGLIVGVYNNKGGIGKTTIVTNLGLVLAQKDYKVLLVDFDSNQADLTNLLNIKPVEQHVWNYLKGETPFEQILQAYKFGTGKQKLQLDVIPADRKFLEESDSVIQQEIRIEHLRHRLVEAAHHYDYVLIDMPPNWRWFAQSGVLASDVLLVPAGHTDRSSLQNLEDIVTKFLPATTQQRNELHEGPLDLLPLVLNRYQQTEAQARNCRKFLETIENKDARWREAFRNFFYVKGKLGNRLLELPYRIEITRAPLEKTATPASLRYRRAREAYETLIKEVLLDV